MTAGKTGKQLPLFVNVEERDYIKESRCGCIRSVLGVSQDSFRTRRFASISLKTTRSAESFAVSSADRHSAS